MEKAKLEIICFDEAANISEEAWGKLFKVMATAEQHANDLHQASKEVADSFGPRAGWFCLQVMTGHEFAVLADLAAVDVEAYVPRRPGGEVVRRGRKWQLPERPWMPNYVFVRVYPSLPALRALLRRQHVLGVVGGMARAVPMSGDMLAMDAAIAVALERMNHDGRYKWGKNEKLRVSCGPFLGAVGTVKGLRLVGKGFLQVELRFLGQPVTVERFPVEWAEPIAK
ncbi:transcription termination/antitermination protein NusG [Allorhizobium sp. Av2]